MRRRDFIAGGLAATVLGACRTELTAAPKLVLSGAGHQLGHRLRSGGAPLPTPTQTLRTGVLIVGGGIGGLGAAWRLRRAGFEDFMLCELESEAGGNARSGRNAIGEYPLGAHYLSLPPREAGAVRELLRELGALVGEGDRLAEYDEGKLAAAPQERLWIDGWWQEGLWPTHRVSAAERAEYVRFTASIHALKSMRGRDGRRPFALPLAQSSTDERWRGLDRVNFREWLLAEGYRAPGLHWMANYATRDDYGTDYRETSAWAGLHYFACRDAGETEGHVLTAPGGNAWLARGLAQGLGERLLPSAMAYRIEIARHETSVDVFLAAEERSVRIIAPQLIWAAPLFVLPHLMPALPEPLRVLARESAYAPWVVVNLGLAVPPPQGAGVGLAWDNVFYDSQSLGYVVSTHQAWRYAPGPTQLTWYRALHEPEISTAAQRKALLLRPEHWAEMALTDIERAHPGLRRHVETIHVHAHGHGMIRPHPGAIWHPAREALRRGLARLRFAHADVAGVSLFEEALHAGVAAAEGSMRALTRSPGTAMA